MLKHSLHEQRTLLVQQNDTRISSSVTLSILCCLKITSACSGRAHVLKEYMGSLFRLLELSFGCATLQFGSSLQLRIFCLMVARLSAGKGPNFLILSVNLVNKSAAFL